MARPTINFDRPQRFSERPQDWIKDPWTVDPSQVELTQRVLDYAEYLGCQWGADVEARYLEVQMNAIAHPQKETHALALRKHAASRSRVEKALDEIFQPRQVPLCAEDIKTRIGDRGLRISIQRLRETLNAWTEEGEIIKRPSPWHGKRWVYSHPDWNPTPQIGDIVTQMSRRHNCLTTRGVVLRWERERATNRVAPVVRFERYYGITTEFADPKSLIITQRPLNIEDAIVCA